MDLMLGRRWTRRESGALGGGATAVGRAPWAAMAEYEVRELRFPRGTTREEARALLTEHAEYGRWELARVRLWPDGRRHVWLRRRIIRVVRTM